MGLAPVAVEAGPCDGRAEAETRGDAIATEGKRRPPQKAVTTRTKAARRRRRPLQRQGDGEQREQKEKGGSGRPFGC